MLHIIGLILKFIGIMIAAIVGLLLTVIAIVLFAPVKYEVAVDCPAEFKKIRANVKISWLFHIIRVRWKYEDGQSVLDIKPKIKLKKKAEKTPEEDLYIEKESTPEVQEDTETTPEAHEETEKPELAKVEQKTSYVAEKENATRAPEQKVEEKRNKTHKKKKRMLKERLRKFKFHFKSICDKIKMITEKKEKIMEFLSKKSFQSSWKKLKKEAVWIRRLLKPKDGMLTLHFGFEDPYHTGQALVVLSMIYPFAGGHMNITPDFEKAVLEGKFWMKGRIRIIYALIFVIKMLLDKNVRETFKEVKVLWENL